MRSVAGSILVLGLAVGVGCATPTVGESAAPESGAEEPTTEPVPPPPIAESEPESLASSDAPGEMHSLDELMAFAIYTPNPDEEALVQTKAARFDKADGYSTVQFCVEPDGTTSNVRTIEKFPGDPMIDQILRDTIVKWRFKPPSAAGFSGKVCTHRKFMIRFAPPKPSPAPG
jgi:TonB family protein